MNVHVACEIVDINRIVSTHHPYILRNRTSIPLLPTRSKPPSHPRSPQGRARIIYRIFWFIRIPRTEDLDGIFQTQFRHNVHSHQLSHQLTFQVRLRDLNEGQISNEKRGQIGTRRRRGRGRRRRRRRKDSPPGSTTWQHKESST